MFTRVVSLSVAPIQSRRIVSGKFESAAYLAATSLAHLSCVTSTAVLLLASAPTPRMLLPRSARVNSSQKQKRTVLPNLVVQPLLFTAG